MKAASYPTLPVVSSSVVNWHNSDFTHPAGAPTISSRQVYFSSPAQYSIDMHAYPHQLDETTLFAEFFSLLYKVERINISKRKMFYTCIKGTIDHLPTSDTQISMCMT